MSRYFLPALLCATLGLAPFSPEPHLIGKLRWVAGGANGMALMDWGDLLMHGFPFVWLAAVVLQDLFFKPKHRVSGEQAKELVAQGAQLIDVRSRGEFAGGSIPGAINIPVGDLASRYGEVATDRAVVVFCASGMRSGSARRMLASQGRDDVYDLGSLRNW